MTSMGYQKAEMQVFLADVESYVEDCLVKTTDDHVRVEYLEAGETRAYAGRALAPGHYTLEGEGFEGRATLHRFPDALVLNGAWEEGGTYGMWRFRLRQGEPEA